MESVGVCRCVIVCLMCEKTIAVAWVLNLAAMLVGPRASAYMSLSSWAIHASVFDLVFLTGCVTGVFLSKRRVHFYLAFLLLESNNNIYYKKHRRLSYTAYKVYLF